eukprot:jgi/Mesen1/10094/ME000074S09434
MLQAVRAQAAQVATITKLVKGCSLVQRRPFMASLMNSPGGIRHSSAGSLQHLSLLLNFTVPSVPVLEIKSNFFRRPRLVERAPRSTYTSVAGAISKPYFEGTSLARCSSRAISSATPVAQGRSVVEQRGALASAVRGGAVSNDEGREEEETFYADPRLTWQDLGLSEQVIAALKQAGFTRPSAVQAASVPAILTGGDVVVAAETGSGKTYAYLAPLVDLLVTAESAVHATPGAAGELGSNSSAAGSASSAEALRGFGQGFRRKQQFALALCPNATLCQQVAQMARLMTRSDGEALLRVVSVSGGEAWPSAAPDLVVATPGALMNHLFAFDPKHRRRTAFVRDVRVVVVDEADMLLSGGFARDVGRLLGLFRLEEKELSATVKTRGVALLATPGVTPSSTRGRPPPAGAGSSVQFGEQQYGDNLASGGGLGLAAGFDEWADIGQPAMTDRVDGSATSVEDGEGGGSADENAPRSLGAGEETGHWTEFPICRPAEVASGASWRASEGGGGSEGGEGAGGEREQEEDEEEEEDEDDRYELADREWEEGDSPNAAADERVAQSREAAPSGRQPVEEGGAAAKSKSARERERGWRRPKRVYERSKQYVFVAATLPDGGKRSIGQLLRGQYPDATWISGQLLHRHNPRLAQAWVQPPFEELELEEAEAEAGSGAPPRAPVRARARAGTSTRTMVFANSTESVEVIGRVLKREGVEGVVLYHRDVPSEERTRGLAAFREDGGVFVCTDAAARGIDIPHVTHVVQAEFATSAVDFLHRVGRTARAGQRGRVTSLYNDANSALVAAVKEAADLGLPTEGAFSRKRSFRKKLKKYGPTRRGSSSCTSFR